MRPSAWFWRVGAPNANADVLGVNRSTLARWMAEHRDTRLSSGTPLNEDLMDELKRLRRENEVLRQERDILKKATAFFVKEGSR